MQVFSDFILLTCVWLDALCTHMLPYAGTVMEDERIVSVKVFVPVMTRLFNGSRIKLETRTKSFD